MSTSSRTGGTPDVRLEDYDENDPLQNRAITPLRTGSFYGDSEGYHTHTDSRGIVHRCYHHCRHRWYIWLPIVFFFQILAFPLEHSIATWLWSQPGFDVVSEWIGWGHE